MRRAIVIVDHGSRREEANRMLEQVAGQLRSMTADRVYAAHMELAEPTVEQAFDAAAAEGADDLFVFPYFLSPGQHSREDIPHMCAAAARKHPGIRWHCSGPIGLDRLMAELILRRVRQCEQNRFQCDDCPDQTVCRPRDP